MNVTQSSHAAKEEKSKDDELWAEFKNKNEEEKVEVFVSKESEQESHPSPVSSNSSQSIGTRLYLNVFQLAFLNSQSNKSKAQRPQQIQTILSSLMKK